MRRFIPAIIGALLMASAATAHVTVKNPQTASGRSGTFTVGVPNERPDSATVAVSLKIPAGFSQVRAVARDGWRNAVRTEGGATIFTWRGGRITGSANAVFRFTAVAPAKAGAYPIPAIQTYADGEVVRWIGPQGAEFEAPVIRIGRSGATTAPATTRRHTVTTTTGTDTTATETDTTTAGAGTETAPAATTDTTGGGGTDALPIYPLFIVFGVITVAVIVGTIAYRRQHRQVRAEAEAARSSDDEA